MFGRSYHCIVASNDDHIMDSLTFFPLLILTCNIRWLINQYV